MITENLSTLKIHKLTQAQYDRELEAGRIDENALYLTPDEEIDLSPYATIEQLKGKADSKHTHDTSDLSGAMPIAKGGTNATTAEDARTNLGIPTIHSGTAAPSSSLGKDGDIYIQYTE
jgi:hypothetical protein